MLRPYQIEARDAIYDYFESHPTGNPLVVMATGTGKSHVIAGFIASAFGQWADTRVMILCHSKELVAQDYDKIHHHLPMADAGVYSAGLKSKETDRRIIFAGIQSAHRVPNRFFVPDLIIIDEAHAIPHGQTGIYRAFLDAMLKRNPQLRVIGFTATPYRLKGGSLIEGDDRLFTDVIYETDLLKMIKNGWLVPLSTKRTVEQLDVSGVKITEGDFNLGQLEKVVDEKGVVQRACAEIVKYGRDYGQGRKSWLIFCASIKHADHVARIIREHGITCEAVHQEIADKERDRLIRDFKSGAIQALTNMNILTTGFDHPGLDMIACLRPTQSAGLWVQILGRGMRVAEGKKDCLVLDFSGNTQRFGPIDMINPTRSKKGKLDKDCPVKWCPICLEFNHISARICVACGYEFPRNEDPKHEATATTASVISQVETFDVTDVRYSRHQKGDKPASLRVDYYRGLERVCSEWVCLDHPIGSYPKRKAGEWVITRLKSNPENWETSDNIGKTFILNLDAGPRTVAEGLMTTLLFAKPRKIRVRTGGKYNDLVECLF